MMKNHTNQSGRSMIEMLGVLAIIGVLSVGGIYAYTQAMKKQHMNDIRNQITHIVAGVKQYYAAQGDYYDLNTETAIKAGIIPSDMEIEDAGGDSVSVKNVYGGNIHVEVVPDTENDSDAPMFVVEITGLPKDAAVDIGTASWNDDISLQAIEVVDESTLTDD